MASFPDPPIDPQFTSAGRYGATSSSAVMQNRFYNDKPFAPVTDWSSVPSLGNYRRNYRGHYGQQQQPQYYYDHVNEEQGRKLNRLEEGVTDLFLYFLSCHVFGILCVGRTASIAAAREVVACIKERN